MEGKTTESAHLKEYMSVRDEKQSYMDKVKQLNKRLKELEPGVTEHLSKVMETTGKKRVRVNQIGSNKMLQLQTSTKKAAFNMKFVQHTMSEFMQKQGSITPSNVAAYVVYSDTQRTLQAKQSQCLSYRKYTAPKTADVAMTDATSGDSDGVAVEMDAGPTYTPLV